MSRVDLGSPTRVLIVEDSLDYRTLLGRLFKREGFDVVVAGHGGEAMTLLETESTLPHLILLDLMMPVMDGYEFRQRQLREPRLAHIPVILLTAHGNLETDPARFGITHFLRKPVEKNHLISVVRSVLTAG